MRVSQKVSAFLQHPVTQFRLSCRLSFALKCQLVACSHIVLILFIPLVWRRQQQLVSVTVCEDQLST